MCRTVGMSDRVGSFVLSSIAKAEYSRMTAGVGNEDKTLHFRLHSENVLENSKGYAAGMILH